MSGLIGDRTGKTLDEMITKGKPMKCFCKEIEKEKQEAERKAREEPYTRSRALCPEKKSLKSLLKEKVRARAC